MLNSNKGLSTSTLKYIAMILMFINHFFNVYFDKFPNTNVSLDNFQLYLTRPSFFIFCFLISEGMRYTRGRKKYILRLLLFALSSELIYDYVTRGQLIYIYSQNSLFDLFAGALIIYIYDYFKDDRILGFISITCICVLDCVLCFGYSILGALLPLMFYICNNDKKKLVIYGIPISIFLSTLLYIVIYLIRPGYSILLQRKYFYDYVIEYGLLEAHGLLSLPFIFLYNKQKGKQLPKLFYYFFYPGHLLLIKLIVSLIDAPIF
ncbi:MAG: TraX family protein [Erysipelotrichaceae bacterium]|nr:TraX family protein [Erysipelotrichaceae bacterium]